MNKPLVSIFMVTYNHEKYIAQAIESVLAQQASFDFELVIGEDASTDKTTEIVISYAQKFPDIVKPIFQSSNIGIKENVDCTFRKCNGKYISILEGDDFWTDTSKLQKQIGFLEKNPDFSICFHNAKTIHNLDSKKKWNYCDFSQNREFTMNDLFSNNIIPTASVVFRNHICMEMLAKLKKVQAGDWYLHLYHAQFGKIYYMHEFWAVYRAHSHGQWAGLKPKDAIKFRMNMLFELNEAFENKYRKQFSEALFELYLNKPLGIKDVIRYYRKKYF